MIWFLKDLLFWVVSLRELLPTEGRGLHKQHQQQHHQKQYNTICMDVQVIL